eukprot:1186796-Prorocentrum_minimum.AAC.1
MCAKIAKELAEAEGWGARSVEEWPKVYLIDRHVPTVDLPRVYKAADAFVLPPVTRRHACEPRQLDSISTHAHMMTGTRGICMGGGRARPPPCEARNSHSVLQWEPLGHLWCCYCHRIKPPNHRSIYKISGPKPKQVEAPICNDSMTVDVWMPFGDAQASRGEGFGRPHVEVGPLEH